ncbi:related to dna excision repair protein ercc-1 [Ustilago sp. UG-2017a]|nr:related to dna excision repair protein ercc-1 [Ustilago sp. UG-2017a]
MPPRASSIQHPSPNMTAKTNSTNDSSSHGPLSALQPASSLGLDHNSPPAPPNPLVQPRPRPKVRGNLASSSSTILVNPCQRGNPLLSSIRSLGWEYSDIVPDYVVGVSSCILFLSIRYHRLHPEYIHTRIAKLSNMFTLRILLLLCDVKDHAPAIKELTKTALINNLTLIVAWSAEEAGRYVETYKSFEHKPPDPIKERVPEDYLSQVTNVLTQVRGVNRTDVLTLITRYGSLKGVIKASKHEAADLEMSPGFGEIKARRLRDVVTQPFRVGQANSYRQGQLGSRSNPTTNTAAVAGGGTSAVGRAAGLLEDDNVLLTSSSSSSDTGQTRDLKALQENLEQLTEHEQLGLAMQLSMHPQPWP